LARHVAALSTPWKPLEPTRRACAVARLRRRACRPGSRRSIQEQRVDPIIDRESYRPRLKPKVAEGGAWADPRRPALGDDGRPVALFHRPNAGARYGSVVLGAEHKLDAGQSVLPSA